MCGKPVIKKYDIYAYDDILKKIRSHLISEYK